MIEKLKFTCCFCNKGIQQTEIDPMNINIMGNYDKYLKKNMTLKDLPSQDFYCHFACLKNKLDAYFQGYFTEDNFIVEEDDTL